MTDDISGLRLRRNQDVLDRMPQLAFEQLIDSQLGRNNTRKRILARQNHGVQEGRLNAALPPDVWESMDDAVYQATKDTLTIVDDLMNAGLTYDIDIRAKYDTWGIIEDTGEARIGMTPEAQSEESDITTGDDGSPVPIIDDGYSIGFREEPLSTERLPESSYDTTKATVVSRHISEALEKLFVDAENIEISGVGDQGYTLYGMTDHPATATGTTTDDWTDDNAVIRDDIRAARATLKNKRNYKPGNVGYWLYLGQDYYDVLDDADPEGDGNKNIRDRVENLANISRIREADFIDDKSMLMFRPTEDVIQVGVGARPQSVQWEDPFRDHYRALASMYPRIKQTMANDKVDGDYMNGILYWTA